MSTVDKARVIASRAPVSNGRLEDAKALIMKGGGAKGLAFLGAIETLVEYGARFEVFVGTSAGAITAALLAAEMSPVQIERVSDRDLGELLDNRAPWFVRWFCAVFRGWIHNGEGLRAWIRDALLEHWRPLRREPNRRDPIRLGELQRRFIAFCTSRSAGLRVFDSHPRQSDEAWGGLSVADVAYSSAAIPVFFRPLKLPEGHYDGGVLANFPIEEFVAMEPDVPFIALYLNEEPAWKQHARGLSRFGILSALGDVVSIQLRQREPQLLQKFAPNIIQIDPYPIGTLDFSLDADEKKLLKAAGRFAALRHLSHYYSTANVTASALAVAMDELEIVFGRVEKKREGRRARSRRRAIFIAAAALAVAAAVVSLLLYRRQPLSGSVAQAASVVPVLVVGSTTVVDYLMCHGFRWSTPEVMLVEGGSENGQAILQKAYSRDRSNSIQRFPIVALASEPLKWCECAVEKGAAQSPSTNSVDDGGHELLPPYQYSDACDTECPTPVGTMPKYFRLTITKDAFQAVRFVNRVDVSKDDFGRIIPETSIYYPQGHKNICTEPHSDDESDSARADYVALPCLSSKKLSELIGGPAPEARLPHLYMPMNGSATERQIIAIGRSVGGPSWQMGERQSWNLSLDQVKEVPALAIGADASWDREVDGGKDQVCLPWKDRQRINQYDVRTMRLCEEVGEGQCAVYPRYYFAYGRLAHGADERFFIPEGSCAIIRAFLKIAAEVDGSASVAARELRTLGDRCEVENGPKDNDVLVW